MLSLRNRAWKRFARTRSAFHNTIFKNIRRRCKLTISLAKRNYEASTVSRLTDPLTTPKFYWKTLKSLLGTKIDSGIPSLIHQGQVLSSSADKSEALNNYFVEQSTLTPPSDGFALPPVLKPSYELSNIVITEAEVLKVLTSLNISKANGPDSISNRLLRESAPSITSSLTTLFNKSLSSGKFPHVWKQANVVPVFKKR